MSSNEMSGIQNGQQLGDYVVISLIARGMSTSIWKATQVSVQREVVLCVADPSLYQDAKAKEEFLADVRTKAAVDHPLIGSVLEAVDDGANCFFALEKFAGTSVGELHEQGSTLKPVQVVRVLKSLAGAFNYLEDHNIATLPLTHHDIFIDDKSHCRLSNMAISGEPDFKTSVRDKHLIGELFHDMLEPNLPGSTRCSSLLGYMADTTRESPLTWVQIQGLSEEVEMQLAERKVSKEIQSPTMMIPNKSDWGGLIKVISIVSVVTLLLAGIIYTVFKEKPPVARELPDMVQVRGGKHPGPDGFPVKLNEFWIDAHEVTIAQYAEFLEQLGNLDPDKWSVYQHEDHPQDKTSHEPDDWQALYDAAKKGKKWQDLQVDLNYPVVGVDWWDAYAYAEWKSRRLPSREEWYVACSVTDDPQKIEAAGWSPVDQTPKTTTGIYGMAGNVAEWTRKKSLNPADPSQPAKYVIAGASYIRPKYGVRAREWVDDRNLRRVDLGFRTMSASKPD